MKEKDKARAMLTHVQDQTITGLKKTIARIPYKERIALGNRLRDEMMEATGDVQYEHIRASLALAALILGMESI